MAFETNTGFGGIHLDVKNIPKKKCPYVRGLRWLTGISVLLGLSRVFVKFRLFIHIGVLSSFVSSSSVPLFLVDEFPSGEYLHFGSTHNYLQGNMIS